MYQHPNQEKEHFYHTESLLIFLYGQLLTLKLSFPCFQYILLLFFM